MLGASLFRRSPNHMACSTVLRAEVGVSSVIAGSWRTPLRAALSALLMAVGASRADAQKLQFRQLTPDDGLSSSRVQAIVQDSRGFVWMGTTKGLNRYDGYGFTIYRHRANDSTSLGGDDALVIYEDSEKTLWVGTPLGLSRYDRNRDAFKTFPVVPGDSVQVSAILEAQGTLWLGT